MPDTRAAKTAGTSRDQTGDPVSGCGCGAHEQEGRKAVAVDPERKARNLTRLRRIEGQVRGLIDMVESGRPCEDVAQQMSAARKAMEKTFYRMMACTVMEAVTSSESEVDTFREVERSTRILEKYA